MATRIYLPWENERGVRTFVSSKRLARIVLLLLGVVTFVVIWRREEERAEIRATRASITTLWNAARAYRADHAGECPRSLSDLVAGGYAHRVPLDAWGTPFRMECSTSALTIVSDGPDRVPGGLDRVE